MTKTNRYKKVSETRPITIYSDKIIEVVWNNTVKARYESLGYEFTGVGKKFLVEAKDLLPYSSYDIEVICPLCKEKRAARKAAITKAGHSYCSGCAHRYDREEANKVTEKKCTNCGNTKPIDKFKDRKTSADGKCHWCKRCHKQYGKRYYKENKKTIKKKREEYYKRNRKKTLEYLRQWREENPDYMYHWYQENKEKDRAKQHRRRAMLEDLPHDWTAKDQKLALEYWDESCCYCEKELNGDLHFDHFIPISSEDCLGSVPENMLPSCEFCNLSKKDIDPHKWISRKFPQNSEEIISRIEEYFDTVT